MRVAKAKSVAGIQDALPQLAGGLFEVVGASVVDLLDRVAMHSHHIHHLFTVVLKSLEGADDRGHFGARQIARSMQQRGDSAASTVGFVGIVSVAAGHQQAAEIGIAKTQRPVTMAVGGDGRRRIAGVIDENFLSDEEHAARVFESLDVEIAV